MKSFILGLSTFVLIQSAYAGTLIKCSVNKRPQIVSGINLFLDGKNTSSAKLFFRTTPGAELGKSTFQDEMKTEYLYYGSDIDRPAGEQTVRVVSSSFFAERYSAKVEIRIRQNSGVATGTLTALDNETYIAKNQSIACDVTYNQ